MYDAVITGQGLTGLLSAIYMRQKGYRTALVAKGTGKLLQSTGVMDFIPGQNADYSTWQMHLQQDLDHEEVQAAISRFLSLMEDVNLPYLGSTEQTLPFVTGAGYIKWTSLYPEAMKPVVSKGTVVIVGFEELTDFVPGYVKGNLLTERPSLTVHTTTISLQVEGARGVSQVDIAQMMDQPDQRKIIISKIKQAIQSLNLSSVDQVIMPSVLGLHKHQEVMKNVQQALKMSLTEAPGLPPNATAVRLYQSLKRFAVKSGVRMFENTAVQSFNLEGNTITSMNVQSGDRKHEIKGRAFISASGNGSLLNQVNGENEQRFNNYFDAGRLEASTPIPFGIIGGIYALTTSASSCDQLNAVLEGSVEHASTV
ncbi:FAD-binding protein [Salisediminibacterium selenitireducens]|uniref:Anaerobic glycerol-3-phosphate dehydrogenase-like protein n=1 Tax=Bacillus selenitireducens (strain ATCC 700615 / DSM 15326 / MLS10) TaxID=439292 RepID=D6XUM2_BACIE|nr:FAD-binding protein [Salisediminibacterium selenitireducens]ADH99508.1 Anaerobic glycerol-3-phosphate dehydrogenase-like protein [[Bacillus] selenitireducens MLS10]